MYLFNILFSSPASSMNNRAGCVSFILEMEKDAERDRGKCIGVEMRIDLGYY